MRRAVTLDCAHRLRIWYSISSFLSENQLEFFSQDQVIINRFSQKVKRAKDHFTISRPGIFYLSGVIGGQEIVVTYSKLSRTLSQDTIQQIEGWILSLDNKNEGDK